MKTKVRLNCYFFSNLIVGLLALNFLYSKEVTLVQVKKDGGKLEPIYVMASNNIEEEKEEVKEEQAKVISNNVTTISVTKKTLASKKVINYVKPSYNSVTGTNLVNYAKHYLGLPYISAGRSLETGTDCSGFTRLIFREFGISLGTTVASQLYSGSYVSKSDLEPGDLVFYGYSTKATHVAIYIGGGQIIHESTPRDGVKISSVNIMVYITARRLITKNVVHEEKVVKEEVKETKVPESPNVQETKPQEEVKEDKVEVNKETPKEPLPENIEEKVEVMEPETPEAPEKKEEVEVKEEVKEEVKKEEVQEQPKQEEVVVPEKPIEKPKEVIPQEVPETTNNTNITEDTSINSTEDAIETSEIAK